MSGPDDVGRREKLRLIGFDDWRVHEVLSPNQLGHDELDPDATRDVAHHVSRGPAKEGLRCESDKDVRLRIETFEEHIQRFMAIHRDRQAYGAKDSRVRTSMLLRGDASAGACGFTKAL